MEPDDELTDGAPLVPDLGSDPDRTDRNRTGPGRTENSSADGIDSDSLRRELLAIRTRLDCVEAALDDRTTDDSIQ